MKRIMITGASGALGSEILAGFKPAAETVGLSFRQGGEGLWSGDLREPEFLREAVNRFRPEVVIHCAAYKDPDFCEAHPVEARRLNVEPARILKEILPESAWLVFISSDYVFDGLTPPYAEESPCRPVNEYGKTKVEAEAVLAERARKLILRVPLLVSREGEGRAKGFLAQAVEAIRSRKEQELDDVLIRYPTWTRDVAGALRFLLEKEAAGIWHFSGDVRGTRYSLTRDIAALLGETCEHLRPSGTVVSRPARRPIDAHLDTTKILQAGGPQPTPWPEVMKNCLGVVG